MVWLRQRVILSYTHIHRLLEMFEYIEKKREKRRLLESHKKLTLFLLLIIRERKHTFMPLNKEQTNTTLITISTNQSLCIASHRETLQRVCLGCCHRSSCRELCLVVLVLLLPHPPLTTMTRPALCWLSGRWDPLTLRAQVSQRK